MRQIYFIFTLFMSFLLLLSASAFAQPVKHLSLGGNKIILPPPSGYVEISEDLPSVFQDIEATSVPESNKLLAVYVSTEDHQLLLNGEEPDMSKYMLVQISKTFIDTNVSDKSFSELKAVLQKNSKAQQKEINRQVDSQFDKANDYMKDEYGVDMKFSYSENIPIKPFNDTKTTYSQGNISRMTEETDGVKASFVSLSITNFVLASERLLYVYVYDQSVPTSGNVANVSGWAKEISTSWAQDIVKAN